MNFKDNLLAIDRDLSSIASGENKLKYYVNKRLNMSLNNYALNIQNDIDYLMSKNSAKVARLLTRKVNKLRTDDMIEEE